MSGKQRLLRLSGVFAGALAAASCTKVQLEGTGPVYAVLDQLSGSAGAKPTEFGGFLASDVLTYVKRTINNTQVCMPMMLEDAGRATLHLAMKDPGSDAAPTKPSPANTITFTRYHVNYVRADGRNTPGVDVPHGFDAGMTTSVVGSDVAIGQVVIVRRQAKEEAPLKALAGGGGALVISTIAEVTFYGTDQAGHPVTVTGHIAVDFSDWADPDC